MSGPIAALGVWANLMVSVNSIDEESTSPAPTPQRKSSTKAKANVPPPTIRRAATAAKASAEIGEDIRWDVIMQQIADIAPSAKFLEAKKAASMALPAGFVKPKDLVEYSVSEDSLSTSAGDTSDSEMGFSDVETPKSRVQPPPGLAVPSMRLPPGLSAPVRPPPGLPPPPGFEAFAFKKSHEELPPWRRAKADRGTDEKASRPWRR